jgi:hypothetical protein
MHASSRASTGQYHSETLQFCPLEKNKFRVVSMFIVICALHGMAAWHVACGALPNRPSGHHFRVVSRALGRRALLRQSRGRDDVFLCLCGVDVGDSMRVCTAQNSPMVVSSLDCLRDGKLLDCRDG